MEGPRFAAEKADWGERFLGVFYRPQYSFAAVFGRETAWDWLLPVLATVLVGLACHQLTIDIVGNLDTPAVKEKIASMDEVQREQYAQSVEMLRLQGWTMIPVGLFTSLVIMGGVMMAIARFVFQSEVTFRQALIIKAYATLVVIPELIVRALLIMGLESPFVYTGPGMLVGEAAAATFFGRVLVGINIFDLWQVGVMGVGLSVMSGVDVRRTTLAIVVFWMIWMMGGAALEMIGAAGDLPPAEL